MQAKTGQTATLDDQHPATEGGQRCVVVLATGGTIAGLSQGDGNHAYLAAQLSIDELLRSAHGLPTVRMEAEQVAQIDSKDMSHEVWHALALRCAFHAARDEVAGIVITHGTDTMEETAYFLSRVLNAGKPVVLTGAMLPADATGADGPGNLANALAVAMHDGARGVMVVMAGQVHAAAHVHKAHPTRVDAFSSGEHALVARVSACKVHGLTQWPASKLGDGQPALPNPQTWPKVEIILSHAGADGSLVTALAASGVQGLVVAATGNGTVHHRLAQSLRDAMARGVAVVLAMRCAQGVQDNQADPPEQGTTDKIQRMHPSPTKARVDLLLQLIQAPMV